MRIKRDELNFIRGIVKFDEPMSRHTSFRIGGPVDVWIAPHDVEDLLNILRYAQENGIEVFVLGGGSKILVGDKGIRGFVIILSNPNFRYIKFNGQFIDVGCGAKISEFLSQSAERNLGGCEFLAGLPGTIGGALMMNAGSPSNGIGDFVEEVIAIKDLKKVSLKKEQINFSYRSSGLSEFTPNQDFSGSGFILITAKVKLADKEEGVIRNEIKDNLDRKRKVQDLGRPSVGCIFMNPSKDVSSGKLIEDTGFKNRSVGGAYVSEKHANFILNRKDAKASDVLRLIEEIQKKVFKDSGIMLKLEVKLVGEF